MPCLLNKSELFFNYLDQIIFIVFRCEIGLAFIYKKKSITWLLIFLKQINFFVAYNMVLITSLYFTEYNFEKAGNFNLSQDKEFHVEIFELSIPA